MGRAAAAAWMLCAFALSLIVAGTAYMFATPAERIPPGLVRPETYVPLAVATVPWPVFGALIAARRPATPVGWLLLAVGVCFGVQFMAGGYATHASFAGAVAGEAAAVAAWVQSWAVLFSIGLASGLLVLLFPSGRLVSPGWRLVVALVVLGQLLFVAAVAVHPGPLFGFPYVVNPFALTAVDAGAIGFTRDLGAMFLLVGGVAGAGSVVLKLRRARGDERQQLKWFAYLAVIEAAILVAVVSLGTLSDTVRVAMAFSLGLLPVGIGIAILRHRLYDIDVLINRTLVYGVLTATLGVGYLTLIVVLQRALSPLTQGSDIAIAGSTLAAATVFRPARSRAQTFVDRRFYRRRYDAAATVGAFSARLRQEVELEAVAGDLVSVVRATMQPAHVSLWLREVRR